METIACSHCFQNEGLRQTLNPHSTTNEMPCSRCGSSDGKPLDIETLERGARQFFVTGSIVAETVAPVYQMSPACPASAALDPTIAVDAELIQTLTGLAVFDYGPPMWRLGYTEQYHDFRVSGHVAAARALLSEAEPVILPVGTKLYRIRRNPDPEESLIAPAAFDPPPPTVARQPGRWDDGSYPVLYLANDVELCLHECRVTLADEIILATINVAGTVRLLDVSVGFNSRGATPFEDGALFADFMSRSRGEDWLSICRAVANEAREAGYDGIRYTSYYSFAMHHAPGINVALFGRPIDAGLLTLHSLNRVSLTSVKYGFAFGPVLNSADAGLASPHGGDPERSAV